MKGDGEVKNRGEKRKGEGGEREREREREKRLSPVNSRSAPTSVTARLVIPRRRELVAR